MGIRVISQRRLTPFEIAYIRSHGSLPPQLTRRHVLRALGGGLIAAAAPPLVFPNVARAQSAQLAALIIRRLEIATAVIEVGTAVLSFIKVYNDRSEAETKPVLLNTSNFRGILEGQNFHEVDVEPMSVLDFEADAPPATSPGDKICTCKTQIDSRSANFSAVT